MNTIASIIESATASDRFYMRPLAESLLSLNDAPFRQIYMPLISRLGERTAFYVFESLIRNSFLIEYVKTRGGATKIAPRWTVEDFRQASVDECLNIFTSLNNSLTPCLANGEVTQLLAALAQKHNVSYELPIDYLERRIEKPIHTADNIAWFFNGLPNRLVALRGMLGQLPSEELRRVFANASEKICVKSYLTDRAQTGEHQTNREKRWETHPIGVQFSFRQNCMEIEYELIRQIFYFVDFPANIRADFEKQGVLIPPDQTPVRCPITLIPLSFEEFKNEMLQRVHGQSRFHVGHIDPLKSTNELGHRASNISWISENGNRIQGYLTLKEVRELLATVAKNYKDAGLI